MEEVITSSSELSRYKIREIKDGIKTLITTVDWRDNSVDCWIECINNHGEKVRIIPDKTGWQDSRREITVMNCQSGINTKLFFKVLGGEYIEPHRITLADEEAKQVMFSIPACVIDWAVRRAK